MRAVPRAGAVLAAAAVTAGCGGAGNVARGSRTAAASPSAVARGVSASERLCARALHRRVAASSPTTVGDLRRWERGGPGPLPGDLSHRPAAHAFASSQPGDPAAYCTVGTASLYTFYGAGPDGTAVRLEGFAGFTGPVPDEPLPVP